MLRFFLALICLLTIVAKPLFAGDMEFRWVTNGGNCVGCAWTAAEGMITKETPDRFAAYLETDPVARQIVFNSPGGDLAAAMKLGRMIREAGFSTGIARTEFVRGPNNNVWIGDLAAGRCESACAFAFMGGVARSANDEADVESAARGRLGMHQFYRREGSDIPSTATQQIMGLLLIYTMDMGIDPAVLSLASKTSADSMYYFSTEELARYKLHTVGARTPYTLVMERDGLALSWDVYHETGELERRATLFCNLHLGAWILRIEDTATLNSLIEFELPGGSQMGMTVAGSFYPMNNAYVVGLETTERAYILSVRLPVDLRAHAGAEFSFKTNDLRNFYMQLSAQGTLPSARQLALLARACVKQ